MELRRRAIKRWVPCGDMDCMLKIPYSAKVECGFRTIPEECLYDSGLNGLQYRASAYNTIQYNTIQYNVSNNPRSLDCTNNSVFVRICQGCIKAKIDFLTSASKL